MSRVRQIVQALACLLVASSLANAHGLLNYKVDLNGQEDGGSNGAGSLLQNIKIGVPIVGRSSASVSAVIGTDMTNEIVQHLKQSIRPLKPTFVAPSESKEDVVRKVKEASSNKSASESQVTINGNTIEVPHLTDKNIDKKGKEVSQTMISFADTLKSVTDEDQCDCDPKDSQKSVSEVLDATSKLVQDLLRCLLDSAAPMINRKESVLIKSIVKISMDSLSKSVAGIYSYWRRDQSGNSMKSVQAVVDGTMEVLNKFSSRLTRAMSSKKHERIETVSYVVNEVLSLVANTSESISVDINENMTNEQLNDVMDLSQSLAEPLTSSVLAQFVNGTARIPMINRMLLKLVIDSRSLTHGCSQSQSKTIRADLPQAVLRALSKGIRAMNIKVGTKDPSAVASQAHRVATTNFLMSLIGEFESMLKASSKLTKVSNECKKRAGEGLSNTVVIVKKIIDDISPEIKDVKTRQRAQLAGSIARDFADINVVLGTHLVQGNAQLQNTTNLIYQQMEVIRRVAKNDASISSDSEAGTQATITLMVDIARLEIKYTTSAVERARSSRDSQLKVKVVRDTVIEMIKSLVNNARSVAPQDNKQLISLIVGAGDALSATIGVLDQSFKNRPNTFADVMYEDFHALTDTFRRIISGVSKPSRSGLQGTIPTDSIYGMSNAIRTTVDWANALTRSSGLDDVVQGKLVRFVIEIIVGVQDAFKQYGKDGIDSSVFTDLAGIRKELETIYEDIKKGNKKPTTRGDDEDFSDNSDTDTSSGDSRLSEQLQRLDELLVYLSENNLRPGVSIVVKTSETTINVIYVLMEDVSRTPHVNEDGSIDLPGGVIIPGGTGGSDGKPGHDGKPGGDGKPGQDGKPGEEGKPGHGGKPGHDGKPGKDGKYQLKRGNLRT